MSNIPPPTMMYQSQMPAYGAHSTYNAVITNSTPTTPPTVTPTDITAACKKKREVVDSLPAKCCHCDVALKREQGAFAELKDGSIIAYCKGGCGRSQVLFVAPTLSTPKYKKVCVFKEDTSTNTTPSENDRLLRMHGVIPHEAKCYNCEKTHKDHETGYDTNGWVECGQDIIALPSDWPTWDNKIKFWV